MNARDVLSLLALILTSVGSILVAWEIFHPFGGKVYGEATFDGAVIKAPGYADWEGKMSACMLIGVGFLLLGNLLQAVTLFIYP